MHKGEAADAAPKRGGSTKSYKCMLIPGGMKAAGGVEKPAGGPDGQLSLTFTERVKGEWWGEPGRKEEVASRIDHTGQLLG